MNSKTYTAAQQKIFKLQSGYKNIRIAALGKKIYRKNPAHIAKHNRFFLPLARSKQYYNTSICVYQIKSKCTRFEVGNILPLQIWITCCKIYKMPKQTLVYYQDANYRIDYKIYIYLCWEVSQNGGFSDVRRIYKSYRHAVKKSCFDFIYLSIRLRARLLYFLFIFPFIHYIIPLSIFVLNPYSFITDFSSVFAHCTLPLLCFCINNKRLNRRKRLNILSSFPYYCYNKSAFMLG